MSKCRVPWCSDDATDVIGEWWHTRFCDEHISTIERDSCVYLSRAIMYDYGGNFDVLIRKFVRIIQGCTIYDANTVMMYNVEKMWFVMSFDTNALRKKFDDRGTIFIEKEVA